MQENPLWVCAIAQPINVVDLVVGCASLGYKQPKEGGSTMKNILLAIFALAGVSFSPAFADEPHTLADVAFLEGEWRGGDDFIFEEIWTGADGGVMTGMLRGVQYGELRVLEYIIIAENDAGVEMRFKHFNKDFSTWEENGPVILPLVDASQNDATFAADPTSETVKSIRYRKLSADALQVDIVVVEDGEEGEFSLSFERVK